MFDLTQEEPISLSEAAALLPRGRNHSKPHVSTILRWIQKGTKAPSGEKAYLDGLRVGSRWTTSREALQRFAERLTPQLDNDGMSSPRTPTERRRAAERAERELEREGL